MLARVINKEFNAVPFVLIESNLVIAMSSVVNVVGLRVLSPDKAILAPHCHAPINTASVISFPLEKEMAEEFSKDLINKFKPKAIITIKKGGMNEKGIIHSCSGIDISKYTANIDFLIREANKKGY